MAGGLLPQNELACFLAKKPRSITIAEKETSMNESELFQMVPPPSDKNIRRSGVDLNDRSRHIYLKLSVDTAPFLHIITARWNSRKGVSVNADSFDSRRRQAER
jgi:hypothetical protein